MNHQKEKNKFTKALQRSQVEIVIYLRKHAIMCGYGNAPVSTEVHARTHSKKMEKHFFVFDCVDVNLKMKYYKF
jgi:hypothetical protein